MRKLFTALALIASACFAQTSTSPGNAFFLTGRVLSATAPSDTNVICWSASGSQWQPCPAGGGSVTLAGDVTGPSGANVLATVNSNVGTWGDATHVGQFTVNGKGLVTAAASVGITGTGGVGTPAYTSTFTGTTVTVTAATHGEGAHPFPTIFDATGAAVSAPYNCKTSGGSTIGCADATSNGDLVIGPVTSGTYSFAIYGATGGFANPMTTAGDIIVGGSSGLATRSTPVGAGLVIGAANLSTTNDIPFVSASGTLNQTSLSWSSSVVGLQFGGTTASFPMLLRTGAGFQISVADNSGYSSLDLGNLNAHSDIVPDAAVVIRWGGRSRLQTSADGFFTMANAANNAFTALQFGGTTSSFPELKRSSTSIAVRLADDSADSPITASSFTVSGPARIVGVGQNIGIDSGSTNDWKALYATSLQSLGNTPSVGTCGTIGTGSKPGAGFITSNVTGSCVAVLTIGVTAATGWSCAISNATTANLIAQTGSSTTAATFTGTTVTGDVLRYACIGY